ncbi:alpha/beta hydrolase [Streptomyces sp. NPDC049555]|uniref:alpha/beta hydrolase n=1 Tax=Streptomyces sp. NPDC049555 TaxID=3154930 RepID=UPI00342B3F4F
MTIDELKNLDTSKFTKAAESWSAVSNRSSAARGRVDHDILATLDATQQGFGADEAKIRLGRLSKNYQYIHAECGMVRTALTGLAEELAGPQRKLKQALEDAAALKFTVQPDGSVEYPKSPSTPAPLVPTPAAPGAMPSLLKPESTPDPNQAKAQDIANRIGDALKEAAEIDTRYARVLSKLGADPSLDKTDWRDVAQDMRDLRTAAGKHFSDVKIPKGKSPKENAEWWRRLSQAERDEYPVLYPDSIGKLDGLPSDVRDEANRIVLAQAQLKAEAELAYLEKHPPGKDAPRYNPITGLPIQGGGPWEDWFKKKKDLGAQIAGMKEVQQRLDQVGVEGNPDAYLIGFDREGLGRAIVANGNPDTAEHTAIYVPGTTSRLSDAGKDIAKMTELWKAANAIPGTPSVATITWIGYDAPQSAVPVADGDIIPEAAHKSYAYKGAPLLSEFLEGVRTAQGGADASHTTVIGHSYGSTVVGATSKKYGLGADDIIAIGSPGVLVGHASDLDAPKGHVWSQAAAFANDQVPAGGKAVHLGGDSDLTRYFNGPLGRSITQNVPSDREFGANIMKTDSKDHGGYWRSKSVSISNQAAVVTGSYGMVKLD